MTVAAAGPIGDARNVVRRALVVTVSVLIVALGPRGPFGCGARTEISDSSPDEATAPEAATRDATCGANGVPVVLTTGPQGAGTLVVDASNAYWISMAVGSGPFGGSQAQVLQCSKCGCSAPTVLATEQAAQGLAVDATSVYWTANGSVMKVPIGGGEATALTVADAGNIAVDATSVYFTNGSTISKVPIGGGSTTTLVKGQPSPGVIAVDVTNVYWTDSVVGTVQKAPVGGGSPTTLAEGQSPSAIAIDATSVYWTNFNNDAPGATVMKVAIAGGGVRTLASGLRGPSGIAVDETNVYWTSDNAVMSVPVEGGNPTTLFPENAYLDPTGVAVDTTSIYWTDSISGALTRLTPK